MSRDPTSEDGRAAAALRASLCGYLMTGVLAVVGAEAVVFTVFLGREGPLWWLSGVSLAAAISLVASLFCGGRGVERLASEGEQGKWIPLESERARLRRWFSFQVWFALGGVVLVLASVVVGVITTDASAGTTDQRTFLLPARCHHGDH